MNIYPVIMCGGAGTRLWPASRPSSPKQFIPLIGDDSLFIQTVHRLQGLDGFKELVVVTGETHHHWISDQLRGVEIASTILLEPRPRDSAPAIAAAVTWIFKHDPEAIAVVLASDHYIPDREAFQKAIIKAAKAAHSGRIVTLGIKPTTASSAYGYIRPANEKLEGDILAIAEFVEKPDTATAEKYIVEGYYWNSGNFIARASVLLDEVMRFAPEVAIAAAEALQGGDPAAASIKLGAKFLEAPKVSIDYAVMEKTERAAVLPVNFAWTDLGAWDAVLEASDRDQYGNAVSGDGVLVDTEGCLVHAGNSDLLVATAGVRNLAIVVERDAVLVCGVKSAQSVKSVVERLKQEGRYQQSAPAPIVDTAGLPELYEAYRGWLFTKALPVWWTLGANHNAWGFHECLDADGQSTGVPCRARVQARQAYSFAVAGMMGWPGPWRSAVAHGLDGFVSHFKRDDGLFRTLVAPDGTILDDTAYLYDQAFALLALAAAKPIRPSAEAEAVALLEQIETQMRHDKGGFREAGTHPFQSNAHMHLLEAALVWIDVGTEAVWSKLAQDIVNLAMTHFIDMDGRFLREFLDADWKPASGDDGRIVEPGHQFEWAWLLQRWSQATGDSDASEAAHNLYSVGCKGVDPDRNVAVDALYEDFTIANSCARLWPQTERMKAGLLLSQSTVDPVLRKTYERDALFAGHSLMQYLDVKTAGLWHDKQFGTGQFANEPTPASGFYHIVCAIAQLRDTQLTVSK